MKIGIEGQRLFRRKKHGMDMVALELIKNLQDLDKTNEYVVFVAPGKDNTCIPNAPNFRIVELNGGPYPIWEQFALPKAVRAEKCDLLHCTGNTGPLRIRSPLILTLHDIIYLEKISILKKGGTWYQKFGNMYRRWIVPPVAKKAQKVVTVSHFEKKRIKNFFGSGKNLVTVYNGVGEHFKKITDKVILENAKIKYNLPDHFLFFLGNTDPKKNTVNVLKAFAGLNQKSSIHYTLVMLDFEENALQNVLEQIGYPQIRKDIHLTGYVPNTELPAIINQCTVFLYPSLRESFGIPILEGMACGVPVITSNTSSMPEIAADAALLVDPQNHYEIMEAILRVTEDKDFAHQLIHKGLNRAADFTWKKMATGYLQLYLETIAENKPQN